MAAAVSFLLAIAALLGWFVPESWFSALVVTGAVVSIVLQVIWISGWAVLPLIVDVALLWSLLALHVAVESLRG